VFTKDLTTATLATERLEVGIVGVNTFAVGAAQIPFGGVKQSGFGSESGTEAMEGYTVAKAVAVQL
jgi:succinate-semialdehyde dehydrogenase/glutarate-semialdehyde dehydrogenase